MLSLATLGKVLAQREVDPALGRFTASDPASSEVGTPSLSSYPYGANRPTVMVDPSGQTFEPSDVSRPFRVLRSGPFYNNETRAAGITRTAHDGD
jgi:hypothetical protein